MAKVKLNNNAFIYPMPMVLVGSVVEEKPNFLAVAWVSRVCYKPPLIAVSLNKAHYTNIGIHEMNAFSVCVPGINLIEKTDYCGIISGRNADKSEVFDVYSGEVTGMPLIDDCPLCMECKLFQTVDLPTNELFIGEIVGAYCQEEYMTDGRPDITKMRPFVLTMPDNNYWVTDAHVAKAWSIGKKMIHK